MVDREALEQFESDTNPYAVDPRLTERDDAVPRSDEVLEYRRRVTWAMIDWKRLIGDAVQIVLVYVVTILITTALMTLFFLRPTTHGTLSYSLFYLLVGIWIVCMSVILFFFLLFLNCVIAMLPTHRLTVTQKRVSRHTGMIPNRPLNVRKIMEITVVPPFRFMKFTNGFPVKHAIVLRQSSWKFMSFPCRDAEDQERMLREIEQFLKRY